MRNIKSTICLIIIAITLTGCISPSWKKYHPSQYPESSWTSDDGRIDFIVSSNSDTHSGTIYLDDADISMVFDIRINSNMISGYTLEEFNSGATDSIEGWKFSELDNNEFTVEIMKTKFLTEGEMITFYRDE